MLVFPSAPRDVRDESRRARPSRARRAWAALLLLALCTGCARAPAPPSSEEDGRVDARLLRVVDGDTLEVSLDAQSKRIRLAEIDAPESAQPWGSESTAALRRLVDGRKIELRIVDVDRYARLVAVVYADGANVNHALVASGDAWAYTEYTTDLYVIALEDEARAARRGLWSLPEAERDAPWAWRRARRRGREAEPADPRCPRRRCAEMTSCEDARFHLAHCGLTRLDADGDGVPCEGLCEPER